MKNFVGAFFAVFLSIGIDGYGKPRCKLKLLLSALNKTLKQFLGSVWSALKTAYAPPPAIISGLVTHGDNAKASKE
jgi:hypothetical protein